MCFFRAEVANENLDASSVPISFSPSAPSLRGSEAAQNFVCLPALSLYLYSMHFLLFSSIRRDFLLPV